jgi:hypothetical protein
LQPLLKLSMLLNVELELKLQFVRLKVSRMLLVFCRRVNNLLLGK